MGLETGPHLLKRLIAARGWPVTRDELIELLWPDEFSDRLSARLSVQPSAVRRILHGGVIADRQTVRLDLDAVDLDLDRWMDLGDDDAIVDGFGGDFLPDDRYDDWSGSTRDELRSRFVEAAHWVAGRALDNGEPGRAESISRSVIEGDPFDELAHRYLVAALAAAGRHGDARAAHDAYAAAMVELGVEPATIDEMIG